MSSLILWNGQNTILNLMVSNSDSGRGVGGWGGGGVGGGG